MDVTYRAVVRPAVEIVVEGAEPNWSAYCPAFPGCVATGATLEETQRNMEEALALLFEVLQDQQEQGAEAQRHA